MLPNITILPYKFAPLILLIFHTDTLDEAHYPKNPKLQHFYNDFFFNTITVIELFDGQLNFLKNGILRNKERYTSYTCIVIRFRTATFLNLFISTVSNIILNSIHFWLNITRRN